MSFISDIWNNATGAFTQSAQQAVAIGPSIDSLAQDWINSNVPAPAAFNGTLAALTSSITQWSQTCGNYVHQENVLHNTANGTSTCQSKIMSMYKAKLLVLEKQEKDAIDNANNTQLYEIMALVIIVMVVIVLILKM